jgi:hypothetical protein
MFDFENGSNGHLNFLLLAKKKFRIYLFLLSRQEQNDNVKYVGATIF